MTAGDGSGGHCSSVSKKNMTMNFCRSSLIGFVANDMELFAAHPDLSRLRVLLLADNDIRTGGAIALANMPQLRGLEELDVRGNRITDRGARALAQSEYLGQLKELHITKNSIRDRNWAVLERRFGDALH